MVNASKTPSKVELEKLLSLKKTTTDKKEDLENSY
jgi:hypothetical protein